MKESFEQWLDRNFEIKPWNPGDGQEPIDAYYTCPKCGKRFMFYS